MTGPVVEWARRWLGVAQLEGRIRLLEAEQRRLLIEVEQLRANIAAAEKVAQRASFSADGDTLARVIGILRRGNR